VVRKKPAAKKPVDKAKQAEKRARREERKAAEASARQAEDRKRRVRVGLASLAAVVVVGPPGSSSFRKRYLPSFLVSRANPMMAAHMFLLVRPSHLQLRRRRVVHTVSTHHDAASSISSYHPNSLFMPSNTERSWSGTSRPLETTSCPGCLTS
jgi:hypothetical protein